MVILKNLLKLERTSEKEREGERKGEGNSVERKKVEEGGKEKPGGGGYLVQRPIWRRAAE